MRRALLAVPLLWLLALAAPAGAEGIDLSDRHPVPPIAPAAAPGGSRTAGAAAGTALEGTFRIEEGRCGSAGVTSGSYFRMVQPTGSPGAGPFVQNGDSPCGDKTYTPLAPGSDGGLVTTG
jgi:hypothetical protein